MNMKKWKNTIIVLIFLILVLISGTIYFSLFYKPGEDTKKIVRNVCLSNDEIADYPLNEKYNPQLKIPKELPVVISVRDKKTYEEKFKFEIADVLLNHYHPIETHTCGVYTIRMLNYDPQETIQVPGFKKELWRYDYNGMSENILTFAENDTFGTYHLFYNDDFRIDPSESHLVLKRSYLGHSDYALVIKSLKTKDNIFELVYEKFLKQYPKLMGTIGLKQWTKDGGYFWGEIFAGADVLAFLRIKRDTWKIEVLPVPQGTMGGDALNSELGYVTYDNGPPWTGDYEFDLLIKEEWQEQGKTVSFYLYNLFTEEEILLTTTNDPLWSFKPKWISDTELEYYLSSGERKIYRIEK